MQGWVEKNLKDIYKGLIFQDIFKENLKLSEKLCSLEGKNICLQNIKRELLEQLGDMRDATDNMEKEISQLRTELSRTRNEKEVLEVKARKFEVFLI